MQSKIDIMGFDSRSRLLYSVNRGGFIHILYFENTWLNELISKGFVEYWYWVYPFGNDKTQTSAVSYYHCSTPFWRSCIFLQMNNFQFLSILSHSNLIIRNAVKIIVDIVVNLRILKLFFCCQYVTLKYFSTTGWSYYWTMWPYLLFFIFNIASVFENKNVSKCDRITGN